MGCSLEHAVSCPAGESCLSLVSMSVLDQAHNLRRLVVPDDDSSVSSSACPYATLLGGMRREILRDRLSLSLHQVESQSPRWRACITRASRGEELHLYTVQVIKDLFGLSPSSLALAISRERIAPPRDTNRVSACPESRRLRRRSISVPPAVDAYGARRPAGGQSLHPVQRRTCRHINVPLG